MWDQEHGGLLEQMDKWLEEIRKYPTNLNAFVATEIDKVKRNIAPFYFDHESSSLQNGPGLWFHDVLQAYYNILAGNDMRETRSTLTGLSSYTEDADYGLVETSVISLTNVPKYMVFKNAMQNLNSTSCLNLAICHQDRMKVPMKNL